MLNLRKFDWISFFIILLLLSIGLTMIYSTTTTDHSIQHDFWNQIVFAIIGLVFYFIFSAIDYRSLKGLGGFFLSISLILLVLVLFLGTTHKRWFDLIFFKFQPSELAKISLILFLADYLDKNQISIKSPKNILIPLFFSLFAFVLVLAQPDLGTASVLLIICLIVLPISGIRLRYYFYAISSFIISLPILWLIGLRDYQKERIIQLFNPSYQVQQAIIAIGSGGFWGKGIGFGTQTQLRFLPVRHTDFIFATLGEELGFAGITVLLILFLVLLIRILRLIHKSIDNFGALVSTGIFAMLFFQIIVNIGVNLGLLPVTGITLPLISYGGSSLLVTFACLGIIQSISIHSKKHETEDI